MEIGIYFRAQRNDKWVSEDISNLTHAELYQYLERFDILSLCRTIDIIEDTLNINPCPFYPQTKEDLIERIWFLLQEYNSNESKQTEVSG